MKNELPTSSSCFDHLKMTVVNPRFTGSTFPRMGMKTFGGCRTVANSQAKYCVLFCCELKLYFRETIPVYLVLEINGSTLAWSKKAVP